MFDVFFSLIVFLILAVPLMICWGIAAIDTRSTGLYIQKRIGQFGKPFMIYKLRTIRSGKGEKSISGTGRFFRKTKIDELPQLLNVLQGNMSVVGPRPDIAGYYDLLQGEQRKILELKPGITGPASIKYKDEEKLLAMQQEPLQYNDLVIFPDKIKINLEYYYNQSLLYDIQIIVTTFLNIFKRG
ncbi:MAG TPA: sugar transferase [Flavobacterium sp.]|jgi:lipopolysaccharide/colanic/teichoic acid biosynthesis glycosyltransferase